MATGTLTTVGQHDWLRLTLSADVAYMIVVDGLTASATGLLGPATAFADPVELDNVVQVTLGVATQRRLLFEPATSGDYFLDLSDNAAPAGSSYTVTAVAVPTDTTSHVTTTKTAVVGGMATVVLESRGQHDWVAVSLVANQGYVFVLDGLDSAGSVRVGTAAALEPANAVAQLVPVPGTATNVVQTAWFEPATSGTYYVDISDPTLRTSGTLTVLNVAVGPADNASTAATLAVGGLRTSGRMFTAGEHDWVAVSLAANQAYLFTATGLHALGAIRVGTAAALDDSQRLGTVPARSTAGTADQTMWFQPATSGTYYVDLVDVNLTAPEDYAVSVQAVASTSTDNAATTTTLTPGTNLSGALASPGAIDWIAVSLVANQAYSVQVLGLGVSADIAIGTAAALDTSASARSVLGNANRPTATRTLWYEPDTSGTYYIRISDPGGPPVAHYAISSALVDADTTDNASTGKVLGAVDPAGSSIGGTLGSLGQHDWVAVSLVANQAYTFTVTGLTDFARVRVGTAQSLDETSILAAVPGDIVEQVPQVASVWFMPATSGTYYIDISDPGVGAGAPWTLTAQPVVADYRDNVTTSGLVLACFAEGTRIARADGGETEVEALRPGDVLRTQFAGAAEVIWTGHRRTLCARHPRPHDVWPVRVREGAFGAGLPERDLVLSPDHAVFADGVLIPVRYLLNGQSVAQEPVEAITYWHVELAAHDVLFAEGLPAESYLDTGNRGAFVEAPAATILHPDFARAAWGARGCAPLMLAGEAVEALRAMLLRHAAIRGAAMTDDPDLRFVVDGLALRPEPFGDWHVLRLPEGAREVRLVSRASVPAHLHPGSADHRRLGVAVGRIALDGKTISLSGRALRQGWHQPELQGRRVVWRWTDGDAGLRVGGGGLLGVMIVMTETYWDETATQRAA